jgi:hypothetical protein
MEHGVITIRAPYRKLGSVCTNISQSVDTVTIHHLQGLVTRDQVQAGPKTKTSIAHGWLARSPPPIYAVSMHVPSSWQWPHWRWEPVISRRKNQDGGTPRRVQEETGHLLHYNCTTLYLGVPWKWGCSSECLFCTEREMAQGKGAHSSWAVELPVVLLVGQSQTSKIGKWETWQESYG